MLSALLRSGDIKDYSALGQDGMAVYTVASQLRDAIKFKRGKTFANYLAIPQRNDQGSKIDWYVPFDSTRPDGQYLIIPWTSASIKEREAALTELKVFEHSILELGKELGSSVSAKGDQLLFARLLCGGNPDNPDDTENLKALRFPNPEHVYLVNDRPVITFWGFSEKNAKLYGSPFIQLTPPAIPSQPIQTETTPISTAPLPTTPPPVGATGHHCKHPCWIFPLLLGLLALLAWFFRGLWMPTFGIDFDSINITSSPQEVVSASEVIIPAQECEERQVEGNSYYYTKDSWIDSKGNFVQDIALLTAINKAPATGIVKCDAVRLVRDDIVGTTSSSVTSGTSVDNGNALSPTTNEGATDATGLTEQSNAPNADSTAPAVDNNQQDNAQAPDNNKDNTQDQKTDSNNTTLPPVDSDLNNTQNPTQPDVNQPVNQPQSSTLQIPSDSLQNGNVNFLNGKWRAGAGIQDKTTGKPLRLNYSFSNGVGQVKVERGDGVQCVGDVAAKMQSGGLSINNNSIAKCSDGSTYQLPTVNCKAGATSGADCQGTYGTGQKFPISMKSN